MKITIESEGLDKIARKAKETKRDIEIEARAAAIQRERNKERRRKEWEEEQRQKALAEQKQKEYEQYLEEIAPRSETLKFWFKVFLIINAVVFGLLGLLHLLMLIIEK